VLVVVGNKVIEREAVVGLGELHHGPRRLHAQ